MSLTVDLLAGWFQFIYVLVPLLSMLAGINGFLPSLVNTVMLVCFPGLLVLMLNLGCAGYVRFLPGQIFSMGKMFMQMECTRGLFGRKMKWQISLKNVLGSIQYGKLGAHILMLTGSAAAVIYTTLKIVKIVPDPDPLPGGPPVMVLAMFWVLLNCWRSWRWITDSVQLTRRTHREYLFEAQVPVLDASGAWIGSTTRLSTKQLEMQWHSNTRIPTIGEELQVLIPGHTVRMIVQEGGTPTLLEVECADPLSNDLLRRSLYSVDWHRMVRLSKHSHMACERDLGGDWEPSIIYTSTDTPHWALRLRTHSAEKHQRLMLEGNCAGIGDKVLLLTMQDGQLQRQQCVLQSSINPARPIPRGLNENLFHFFGFNLAPE